MATATLLQNAKGGYPIKLDRENGVFKGTKHFQIVGAVNIGDTYSAFGLPDTGDPFDSDHPQVKARGFSPKLEPGSHGIWNMTVSYSEDVLTGGSGGVLPEPGLEMTVTLDQSRVTENVNESFYEPKVRLTNGDTGLAKMLNVLTFVVMQYSQDLPNLTPMMELSDPPKVNKEPLTLVRFMGIEGSTIPFDKYQLLYGGFSISREGGLYALRHELLARRDWRSPAPSTDAAGKPLPDDLMLDVYEQVDFLAVLGAGG